MVGNWKVNGPSPWAQEFLPALLSQVSQLGSVDKITLAVCPPFVYLSMVADSFKDSVISVGALTLCQFGEGAYTGEISGRQIKDFGADFVLCGHSERRQYFGETDEVVLAKIHQTHQ